eukprot:TRINITY_DN5612_c0_g1_i1.p1 TRINITY_DN5612_c0_g1~~TRINITY_DN5612_c0_g1_i1.p1  ORF type:complete len:634 (+),score=70.25 TRINITY_DN5612_c0_g1_i1:247-1902(+)
MVSEGNMTFFAPKNSAFAEENFPKEISTIINDKSQEELVHGVLLLHIVPKHTLLVSSLSSGQSITVTSQNNESLRIVKKSNAPDQVVVESFGSTAAITEADIEGKEGVLHIVDRLLLPFFNADLGEQRNLEAEETFGRYLQSDRRQSILSTILQKNELSTLRRLAVASGMQMEIFRMVSAGQMTFFAPKNSAFDEENFPKEFSDTLYGSSQEAAMRIVLLHHIVPKHRVLYSSFNSGEGILALSQSDQSLSIRKKEGDGQLVVESFGSTAAVTEADIEGREGVLHIVDRMLLPSFNPGEPPLFTYLRAQRTFTQILKISQVARFSLPGNLSLENAGPITAVLAQDSGLITSDGEPIPSCFFNSLLRPENEKTLANILMRMLIPGLYDLEALSAAESVTNLAGETVVITNAYEETYVSGIPIVHANIPVANGMLHITQRIALSLDEEYVSTSYWTCVDEALRFFPDSVARFTMEIIDKGKALPGGMGRAPSRRPNWVAEGLEAWYPPPTNFPASKRDITRAINYKAAVQKGEVTDEERSSMEDRSSDFFWGF